LVKACLNKQLLSLRDVEQFWHSIVFFIFVEETLPGNGVRPTEKQWNSHRPISPKTSVKKYKKSKKKLEMPN
jgi:hypothetical protein